jgi:hypothetical protein
MVPSVQSWERRRACLADAAASRNMGRTLKPSQKPIIDGTIGKSDQSCLEQFAQFQQRRLLAPRQRLVAPKQAE